MKKNQQPEKSIKRNIQKGYSQKLFRTTETSHTFSRRSQQHDLCFR